MFSTVNMRYKKECHAVSIREHLVTASVQSSWNLTKMIFSVIYQIYEIVASLSLDYLLKKKTTKLKVRRQPVPLPWKHILIIKLNIIRYLYYHSLH